jgi:hypothetical protein
MPALRSAAQPNGWTVSVGSTSGTVWLIAVGFASIVVVGLGQRRAVGGGERFT